MTIPPLDLPAATFRSTGGTDHPMLEITGEVDMATSGELRVEIYRLIDSCVRDNRRPTIAISLLELEFIDSSGLRALLDGLKRARSLGGSLELQDLSLATQRLFEITGLLPLFDVAPA